MILQLSVASLRATLALTLGGGDVEGGTRGIHKGCGKRCKEIREAAPLRLSRISCKLGAGVGWNAWGAFSVGRCPKRAARRVCRARRTYRCRCRRILRRLAITKEIDSVTGAKILHMKIEARKTAHDGLFLPPDALLQLGCLKNQPPIHVMFAFQIGSKADSEIFYRFDDKPAQPIETRILPD